MKRSAIRLVVLAGLLAALVVVLWPQPAPPPTNEERTLAIASVLRCPFCNGESIADAPSAIARDLQDFIGEEVAAGRTDREIIDFFVATYGEQVVLAPPLGGWGVWLWALPLLALAGGVVLIGNRLRGARDGGPVDAAGVAELLGAVRHDIAELDIQVVTGEVDPTDAERLRRVYEAEAARLAEVEFDDEEPASDRKRMIVGVAILLAGFAALTIAVIAVADDRAPGGLATGNVPRIDFESITNEELERVIAENPDVVGMRLALARRYFEAADFTSALDHYLYILERADQAEALANVGWMTFLSGEPDTGRRFVERALTVDPTHRQAYWFLANIRLFGYDDAAGAIEPLEMLLTFEDVPADIRAEAERLLTDARAAA